MSGVARWGERAKRATPNCNRSEHNAKHNWNPNPSPKSPTPNPSPKSQEITRARSRQKKGRKPKKNTPPKGASPPLDSPTNGASPLWIPHRDWRSLRDTPTLPPYARNGKCASLRYAQPISSFPPKGGRARVLGERTREKRCRSAAAEPSSLRYWEEQK